MGKARKGPKKGGTIYVSSPRVGPKGELNHRAASNGAGRSKLLRTIDRAEILAIAEWRSRCSEAHVLLESGVRFGQIRPHLRAAMKLAEKLVESGVDLHELFRDRGLAIPENATSRLWILVRNPHWIAYYASFC